MSSAFLFLGGAFLHSPHIQKILQCSAPNSIIAADHGADIALRYGVTPSIVIGDIDSLTAKNRKLLLTKNVEFLTYPTQKDQTDSELALEYLTQKKILDITCIGFEGDRPDHFLTNTLLFPKYVEKGMKITALGKTCVYYFFSGELRFACGEGDLITLLSLTPNTTEIMTHGLRYSLKKQTLSSQTSLGVSNVAVSKNVSISSKNGVLLAIHTFK